VTKTGVTIEGTENVIRKLRALGQAGEQEGARAVRATAEKIRTDAVRAIQQGPATGRTYERGSGQNLSASHTASAPGEAPMTDTGNLASSGRVSHEGLGADIIFQAPYAKWLEYGTMKMGERPFLVPALKSNQRYFSDQLQRAISRAADKADRS